MNLLYYYVEKKQIYNQKHHYQPWIPTQESRKTHTHFQTLVFFSKKKNENKNQVFNLTSNYWA